MFAVTQVGNGATKVQDEKPAKLTLTISTEDDVEPDGIYLLYTYQVAANKPSRTKKLNWPTGETEHEVEVPVTTSRVVVVSNNFAPSWVLFQGELAPRKTSKRKITLQKGVAHKFRVTDDQGEPINKILVSPSASIDDDVSFSWRTARTNQQGEATLLFPKAAIKHEARIWGQNYQKKEVTLPAKASTTNARLKQKARTVFEILDHQGNPVKNNRVCFINAGSTFTDSDRDRPIWQTDNDGKFEVRFTSPLTANMIIETKSNRAVFKGIKTEPGKTITLRMPKPRTLKFLFSGDRNILKNKTLRVLNGTFDAKRRQFVMEQPHQMNKDQTVLTVHGIVDGWVALSFKGEKGNLYWCERIQSGPTEININLDLFKEHQRRFRFVFLHDGKEVKPKGSLSFYVRSKERSGDKHQLSLSDDPQWSGTFKPTVRDIRIVNAGLEDYYIDGIDGSNDHRVKLTPMQQLDSKIPQTISIPVRPSGAGTIQVFLPSGEPAERAFIQIYQQGRHLKNSVNLQGSTDSNGIFQVPKLDVKHRDHYRYQVKPQVGFQRIFDQNIRPGDSLKVTLEKGRELSGRIVNQKKIPMARMVVEAVDRRNNLVDTTSTNFKGEFKFTRLNDSPVKIRARHVTEDVKVKLSRPYKPGEGKKIELEAIDRRKYKSA